MPKSLYVQRKQEEFWESSSGQLINAIYLIGSCYAGAKLCEALLLSLPV